LASWIQSVKDQFILNFVQGDRWKLLVQGLGKTLEITFFAVILGIVLGVVLAIIRSSYDKNAKSMHGLSKGILSVLNFIAKIYLTVIRGTPVVVQLLIMYYIIFASSNNKLLIAILSFGLNSAAYVAEIFRSGIMSIDAGQFEAGRAMGLNFVQTMVHIIIPQAFKNVLPALANEVIVLLKETSVAGYVAMTDLTRAGNMIRGVTFSPFMPLIAVALIYLVMVVILTKLVSLLERRLRASDH
jgi:His/Glu/Gln/Arg/opine family amino acid ABC transporter permease subunit